MWSNRVLAPAGCSWENDFWSMRRASFCCESSANANKTKLPKNSSSSNPSAATKWRRVPELPRPEHAPAQPNTGTPTFMDNFTLFHYYCNDLLWCFFDSRCVHILLSSVFIFLCSFVFRWVLVAGLRHSIPLHFTFSISSTFQKF